MSSGGKGRAARLRIAAGVVLAVGVVAGFVLGSAFPALVTGEALTGKAINWLQAPRGAASGTAFNWLLFVLTLGPTAIASSILVGAAEIAQSGSRRSRAGRIRDSDDLELT